MPATTLIPPRLRRGDEVRVIAPSRSLSAIGRDGVAIAESRFAEMGLRVSYGAHVEEMDAFKSSSVEARIADLHAAFADPGVRGVLTVIGGFNANQLLPRIDWDLVRANPKVFCGYSDITALSNAMFAATGLVTYSGPHFSTFGMVKGLEHTVAMFRRCVMETGPYEAPAAAQWSDDAWFADQENRKFHANPGPRTIHAGVAEGTAGGGNLCTLNLLHGTRWMPPLEGAVLFVEEDDLPGAFGAAEFDRNLVSVLQQPGGDRLAGVAIGRFQPGSQVTDELLRAMIASKPELARVPVACGFDFGHTTPHTTIPIGGRVRLDASGPRARLHILEH